MSQDSSVGGSKRRAESPERGPNAATGSHDQRETRATKARRFSSSASPATTSTALSRATFTGGNTNQYKAWLRLVTPAGSPSYDSFLGKQVRQEDDQGHVFYGTVQSITQGLRRSENRIPATNAQFATESLPFTIVWHDDNTDSAVSFGDLQTMLVSGPKIPAKRSSTSGSSGGRPGAAAARQPPPPNPTVPSVPAPPALTHFTGLPTSPGDIVDILRQIRSQGT